jgi:hypothetical protein
MTVSRALRGGISGSFLWSAAYSPLLLVLAASLVTGLLIVVIFRYTSDQKAIRRAKDQLQAQLLAVRLFQDQLQVVLRAYLRIVLGTLRYVRLTLLSTAVMLVPLVPLMVQLDRYLGWTPLVPGRAFLVKVRVAAPDALQQVDLQLPPGLSRTATPVRIPAENEVVWRVMAEREGSYEADVVVDGQRFSKEVIVAKGLARISAARWRGHFWRRLLESGEASLPEGAPVEAIYVTYLPRTLDLAFAEWNWMIVFFLASMAWALLFKKLLRIEI